MRPPDLPELLGTLYFFSWRSLSLFHETVGDDSAIADKEEIEEAGDVRALGCSQLEDAILEMSGKWHR